MDTKALNTAKENLVRYILKETDENIIEALQRVVSEKKASTPKPKTLTRHLGKLKRGIDGLSYQKMVRNEWD
ncbi:MAG: hypothetical protein QM610_06420 [Chitinophagaceae bacterium]